MFPLLLNQYTLYKSYMNKSYLTHFVSTTSETLRARSHNNEEVNHVERKKVFNMNGNRGQKTSLRVFT